MTYDRERDLALLQATSTLPDLEPIPWVDDTGIGLGESILVLGFPFPGSLSLNDCSESITVTRGILSGRLDILGQAMLQTDAPLNPGVSGGLAVTDTGAVVGMAVSGLNPVIAESVGFLVPAGVIREQLDRWLTLLASGSLQLPEPEPQLAFGLTGGQIVTANLDGKNLRTLTVRSDLYYDSSPTWSPDGSEVAFHRRYLSSGYTGIFVVDVATLTVAPLIVESGFEFTEPDWSPDGLKILASCGPWNSRTSDICVVDVLTGRFTLLTDTQGINESSPEWSQDGNRIIYSARGVGSTALADIYVMNSDGGMIVQVTRTPDVDEIHPTWSPDGADIAFASRVGVAPDDAQRAYKGWMICSMLASGASLRCFDGSTLNDWRPAWSPDGDLIAFEGITDDGGHNYIYVMLADGRDVNQIEEVGGGRPSWTAHSSR